MKIEILKTERCPLEFVRQEGDRYIHRCPVCNAEARSKYRDPAMRKQSCGVVRTGRGVGDEMAYLLNAHGAKTGSKCDCAAIRRQMNQLGPEGCRTKAAKLVKLVAAGWSIPEGSLSIAGLLDLAIQRAEEHQREAPPPSPAEPMPGTPRGTPDTRGRTQSGRPP